MEHYIAIKVEHGAPVDVIIKILKEIIYNNQIFGGPEITSAVDIMEYGEGALPVVVALDEVQ